jgi:predicted glycosyltransferase
VKVWIDLSNSPHPLLFAPIARRLQELGHEVGITARDNAQTVELTIERWPQATVIGGQSPKSRLQKGRVMGERIAGLRRWAQGFRPDVALSHNSYGQIVAARSLRLPVVTAMDYEGQPINHLAFRLAHTILMPEALRGSAVRHQGASPRRTLFYRGFKEEIYLGDFEPATDVLHSLHAPGDRRRLVVARTPPSRATYHQFENTLFRDAVVAVASQADTHVVVLVRQREERGALQGLGLPGLTVPDHALDSRSLMFNADLVVGAGGTMTREAALMRLPTYSVFAGEQPAVDRELERQGLLRRLQRCEELVPVLPRKGEPMSVAELRGRASHLIEVFTDAVLAAPNGRPSLSR